MRYYITFFQIIIFCQIISNSLAQDNSRETLLTLNELDLLNNIQVFVDRKQITDWRGVRRHVKLRDFSVAFDSAYSRTYSNLIISAARITLIRNDKPIALTVWHPGNVEPLNIFFPIIQLGDRYEMKFTFTAQRKTGEQITFANKLIYNLPLL